MILMGAKGLPLVLPLPPLAGGCGQTWQHSSGVAASGILSLVLSPQPISLFPPQIVAFAVHTPFSLHQPQSSACPSEG